MIGIRNRLIHRYDDVDFEVVWNTAKNELPPLLESLEPLALP